MEIQNAKTRGCKIKVSRDKGVEVRHEVQGDLPFIQKALTRDGHWEKCKEFIRAHIKPRCKIIYGYSASDPEIFIQSNGHVYGMHLINGTTAHYRILQGEDCMAQLITLKEWLHSAGHSYCWQLFHELYPWSKVQTLYQKKIDSYNVYFETMVKEPLTQHLNKIVYLLGCSGYSSTSDIMRTLQDLSTTSNYCLSAYGFVAHKDGHIDIKIYFYYV